MIARSAGTVSSDFAFERAQHLPVGELGQPSIDRIVQPQSRFLDQRHRGSCQDRLGDRRDPEDRIGSHRPIAAERGHSYRLYVGLAKAVDQGHETRHPAALGVASHRRPHGAESIWIPRIAHRDSFLQSHPVRHHRLVESGKVRSTSFRGIAGDQGGIRLAVIVRSSARRTSVLAGLFRRSPQELMMRIAMIAPLVESVPPPLYGGTERVVSVLTDELARRGHDVTLFASADSFTPATLVPMAPLGLRLDPAVPDSVASYQFHHMMMLGEVYRRAADFDVIHSHVDPLAFPFARLSATPTVSTLHGRLDLPEIQRVLRRYPEQALVSISDGQRRGVENLHWVGTVHNGVAVENFTFQPEIGGYLVFLGRITPEKRPDRAIEIARGRRDTTVIAAKVDPVDIDYYKGFHQADDCFVITRRIHRRSRLRPRKTHC